MEIRYIDPKKLKPHPLNESLIPPMTPEEFEALVEDVKEKGVLQPLEVQKGTNFILDGRNRWKAALRANLESIPYREVDVPEKEVALYILERVPVHRNLTKAQKASLAAEYVLRLQKDLNSLERRLRNLLPFQSTEVNSEKNHIRSAKIGTSETDAKTGKVRELASIRFGVSHTYIQIALNLKRYAPESFELLKRGEITLQEAQGILTRARIEKEAAEIVAFPGPVLLKRTHHVREEANDHSPTHDSRGTQSLQEKTWPLTEGSCGIAGNLPIYHSPLGDRQKSNSILSLFHFGLSRKRNPLVASHLNSLSHYPSILDFAYLISYCLFNKQSRRSSWKSNTPSPVIWNPTL